MHVLAELSIQHQQIGWVCALNRLVKVMKVEHVVEALIELLLGNLGNQKFLPVLRGKEYQNDGYKEPYED